MNAILHRIVLLGLGAFASATRASPPAENAPVPAATQKNAERPSQWVFSILPKSLQKNPRLELTVITEMTEEGKKLPAVSPGKPAYFELFSAGYRELGDPDSSSKTFPAAEIESLLTRSLGGTGYLRAKRPEHPPSLLIVYTWGSHNRLQEGDPENPTLSGQQVARNILDRAALVGGEKFAKELLDLFLQADDMAEAAAARPLPDGEQVFTPELMAFANPVNAFRRRSTKNELLLDQTANDIYYVVASAYDYRSTATNRRKLLWRTRMTVASAGVSQEQALPALVVAAGPYFGQDMPEPQILSKRSVREGTVEVGTPTIVESNPLPAAPPSSGPKEENR